ncbi:hypothetical protein A1F99_119750 [Pyrenophora tritici-repentis]|nr:hypothetical protein A1F99_119750 [Pyrenophora tritici-repentis]
MFNILHDGLALNGRVYLFGERTLRLAEHFVCDESELVGALEQHVKGWFEFEDGFEDGAATQDV